MKDMTIEQIDYDASNREGPSTPSHDDCYCGATERLPSWIEFAEGLPIFSRSRAHSISMNMNGSNYKRNRLISLESREILFRNQSYFSSPPPTLTQEVSSQFHLLTSLISPKNANAPLFVDIADLTNAPQKVSSTYLTAHKCDICGRGISRDIVRHIRTHDREAKFRCFYPRACCPHKTGHFHRNYDFKKHLLHHHFILHDSNVKRLKNLTDKLEHEGTCPCGKRMKASEWLKHIFVRESDGSRECKDLSQKKANDAEVDRESRI
jgi:hypothetical protein